MMWTVFTIPINFLNNLARTFHYGDDDDDDNDELFLWYGWPTKGI